MPPSVPNPTGVVSVLSPHSVDVTLTKLKHFIDGKGLTLFAEVDHGAAARQVGLEMQPAHVLVFGHPKAGTPLMVASPLFALDLPLKVLVWEDVEGKTWVSYHTPDTLVQGYAIPPELVKNIAGVEALVAAALR